VSTGYSRVDRKGALSSSVPAAVRSTTDSTDKQQEQIPHSSESGILSSMWISTVGLWGGPWPPFPVCSMVEKAGASSLSGLLLRRCSSNLDSALVDRLPWASPDATILPVSFLHRNLEGTHIVNNRLCLPPGVQSPGEEEKKGPLPWRVTQLHWMGLAMGRLSLSD
jgi:hypothetical protein